MYLLQTKFATLNVSSVFSGNDIFGNVFRRIIYQVFL